MKLLLCIVVSVIFSTLTFAADRPDAAAIRCDEQGLPHGACKDFPPHERLTPYEPSYGVLQQAAGDEDAIRLHYSFKYCLMKFNQDVESNSCRTYHLDGAQSNLYFSYTGEFDFYMGSRPSGPVINRLNNPAFHLRMYKNSDYFEWLHLPSSVDWVDVAFEHRSNGQVLEVRNPAITANAQTAYSSNNHAYFDAISRGANYLSLETKKSFDGDSQIKNGAENHLSIYGKVKHYFAKESDVTWGQLAGTGVSISDYDRVKLTMSQSIGEAETSLDWTIGDKGLSTDSWNASYLFNKNDALPFFIQYHNGPMHTLSNYTQNQHYLGIGLKFVP